MDQAQLIASVASAAVTATLAASGGTRSTPKTPTTPKPVEPPRRAPAPVDRDRLAVSIHESGHAVAGVILGAEFRNAVVGQLRDGRRGATFFDDRPYGTDAMIGYSGPWAQAKFQAGGRRPTQREFFAVLDGHGCHDRRALVAAGGTHLGADVEPIVARCWTAILTLSRQLHREGEVVREDVLRALGVDMKRPIGSQIANIRAGMQSVPDFTPRTPAPA